jgi:hypothetical protein
MGVLLSAAVKKEIASRIFVVRYQPLAGRWCVGTVSVPKRHPICLLERISSLSRIIIEHLYSIQRVIIEVFPDEAQFP